MEFLWDDPDDEDGNTAHIQSGHPGMTPPLIEEIFAALSGDDDLYESTRSGIRFLVLEKTHGGRLYRIVFQIAGDTIKVKTAFPIKKRKGPKP